MRIYLSYVDDLQRLLLLSLTFSDRNQSQIRLGIS